jgi:diadenosine tetraphosphate (Ap4A) HIT family hydrolase
MLAGRNREALPCRRPGLTQPDHLAWTQMSFFNLNPRLEGDSHFVTDLTLCTVRLMKDANYPWLLLIPRQPDLVEVIDLEEADQLQLMREIALASRALRKVTDCEKLNVGALGNQVSQLHVHVIARYREDAAWPGPVWGAVPPLAYEPEKVDSLIDQLQQTLADDDED